MSQPNPNRFTSSVQSSGQPLLTRPGPLAPLPEYEKMPTLEGVRRKKGRSVRLDTLNGQFTLLVGFNVLLTLIGLLICFVILASLNNDFNEIINNSAPSIVAAQKLGQAIEDADAEAMNYQLYFRIDLTSPDYDAKIYGKTGLRGQSWNNFLRRRQEIYDLLYQARANITYPGEADAISIITNRFFDYQAAIEVMKYELDQGHREVALAVYKSAHDLLVGNLNNVSLDDKGRTPEQLLKLGGWQKLDPNQRYLGIEANIEKLSQINRSALDKAAHNVTGSIDFYTLLVVFMCLLLVSGLGFLCLRHMLVTHRLLNPGYVLALVGTVGLSAYLITSLVSASKDYTNVSTSSFISIEAAARIRALGYDANADESRLLLSPESPGLDSSNPALTTEVRKAFRSDTLTDDFVKKQALIKDQLAIAWGNVTYSGERLALCQTSQTVKGLTGCASNSTFYLDNYLKLDQDIRTSFSKNLLAEAIKVNTGTSNDTFSHFDSAIGDLSKVNEAEFDRSACQATGRTHFGGNCTSAGYIPILQYGCLIAFPLIMLMTIGGLWYIRSEF
jgi:hypothetical protein